MNYQKIYTNLISKRRLYKIDKTKQNNNNIEYHHIVPVSCGGKNDKGIPKNNNIKHNIIGLTLREHFFAHLLLVKIYKQKYGIKSKHYFCMLKAINLMANNSKYKIKSSRLYESLRLQAITIGCHKTTTNRFWVTNGIKDIFLKPQQQIPVGFKKGRTINFTKQQADEYSRKIKEATKNRIPWNKGKKNIYNEEHRRKISQNHADVSGQKNGRFGSRSMYNLQTKQRKIVHKNQIQKYLDSGWVFSNELKIFNNGEIELLDINCPIGFVKGKLKKQYTDVELEQLHKKRSEIAKQANRKRKTKNG